MSLNIKYIPYGEASVPLVKHVPGDFGDLSGVTPKIAVATVSGGALLAETSTGVAVYAGTTLNAAIVRGDTQFSVVDATAPALAVGRLYRVRDSATDRAEDVELVNFEVSGTDRICEVRERFEYSHASGAAVTGRYITKTLDVSTVATWAKLFECLIIWSNLGAVGGKLTDVRTIRTKIAQFGGLLAMFEKLYPQLTEVIPGGTFEDYVDAAHRAWRRRFFERDRKFDALVDVTDVSDLMLAEICRRITSGKPDLTELAKEFRFEGDRLFESFVASSFWADLDDDNVRSEAEYQKAILPPFRRFR